MTTSAAMAVLDAVNDVPHKSKVQQRMTKSCSECGRRFLRTEHLQRHQRTHTRETPFSCPYCHRGFQRSDVCNRHVAKSCLRKVPDPENFVMVERSARVRVACDGCRAKKLKCTGGRPCSACNKGNRECSYTKDHRVGSKPSEKQNPHPLASPIPDNMEVCVDPSSGSASAVPIHAPQCDAADANVVTYTFAGTGRRPSNAMHLDHSPVDVSADNDDNGMLEDDTSVSRLSPKSQHRTSSHSSTVSVTGAASLHPVPQPVCQGTGHLDLSPVQATTVPPTSNAGFDPAIPLDLPSWDLNFGINWSNDFTFDLFSSAGNFFLPSDFDFDVNEHAVLASGVHHNASGPQHQSFSIPVLNTVTWQQDGLEVAKVAFPDTSNDAIQWVASEPSMNHFDRVIINHFINLFLREVPSTFTSFIGFEMSKATSEEEVLAMAAVGGLYSTTRGSHIIARAMSGDARRLALTRIHVDFPDFAEQKICLVRTLILLELYGICSGDKRYCELSEAFHIQFLQTVSRCNLASLPETSSSYRVAQRIMDDIQILECYRVTLLQWPPNFYMNNSFIFSTQGKSLRVQPPSKQLDALKTIRALLTPSGPSVNLYQRHDGIYTLAALLLLAFHAVSTQSAASQSDNVWDKRFFVLGLHSWLRWQEAPPDASTLMLFHMGFVVLHTNMANLHRVVREVSVYRSPRPATLNEIRHWRESDGCDIALMHATQVLELGMSRPGHSAQSTSSVKSGNEEIKGEAPHKAICVYLAAVTKWVAEISRPDPDLDAARAVLVRGFGILQRLNLRIANGFGNMLRRLEENSCQ